MITPQQLEEVTFSRATFGGYDMQAVDEFLEPLTEDYITLYKENALLKSKMRVLVAKLEEYRHSQNDMDDTIADTQRLCARMIMDAQEKCEQLLRDAGSVEDLYPTMTPTTKKVDPDKLTQLENQLKACLGTLEDIRGPKPAPTVSMDATQVIDTTKITEYIRKEQAAAQEAELAEAE